MRKTLVWVRQDIRLLDHPALHAAAKEGDVALIYTIDESKDNRPLGRASKWWLKQSLDAFKEQAPLIVKRGEPLTILKSVIESLSIDQVFWNRCYTPYEIQRDTKIKKELQSCVKVQSFNGSLLAEPWEIKNQKGEPFKVFTPFWKTLQKHLEVKVLQPTQIKWLEHQIQDDDYTDLHPQHPDWSAGMQKAWTPGKEGAKQRLEIFLKESLGEYAKGRDFLDEQKTSRLSPHLHFGEISPRQILNAVSKKTQDANTEKFLAELGWREFSYHLLYHFPQIINAPLREEFKRFPWSDNATHLKAWQKGKTGVPVVDAAMQELWVTGYMHNRARMIVASFLTKHLLIPWQEGEAWFWDTLCDADPANNSASWQWVSGCGADAAPYFRIFNPVLQGEKFDPSGKYVRKWLPKLANLPDKFLHCPWNADEETLRAAGLVLGKDYPKPIVDLKEGRDRALKAFETIKK